MFNDKQSSLCVFPTCPVSDKSNRPCGRASFGRIGITAAAGRVFAGQSLVIQVSFEVACAL
jgi:hypothetical protein